MSPLIQSTNTLQKFLTSKSTTRRNKETQARSSRNLQMFRPYVSPNTHPTVQVTAMQLSKLKCLRSGKDYSDTTDSTNIFNEVIEFLNERNENFEKIQSNYRKLKTLASFEDD